MLAGDAAAVFLAGEGAVGDAQQSIVRLRLRGLGVIDVVGRHQGDVAGVGPFDQPALGLNLAGQAVALQFDVETVAEHPLHLGQGGGGLRRLLLHEQGVDRTVGTAGQQDQSLGLFHNLSPGHARLVHLAGVEVGGRRQGAQVEPALLVLGDQHDCRRLGPARRRPPADVEHRQGAADDRLNARVLGRLAELQRPEQVGPIGDRHGRHPRLGGHLADLAGLDRPLQQGIGAADPQMDKALTVHPIRQSKTPHRSARSNGHAVIMQGVCPALQTGRGQGSGSRHQEGRLPDHPDEAAARRKRQQIPHPTRH
ncbi:hypothetical protein D3C73_811330 [compost metagenome]